MVETQKGEIKLLERYPEIKGATAELPGDNESTQMVKIDSVIARFAERGMKSTGVIVKAGALWDGQGMKSMSLEDVEKQEAKRLVEKGVTAEIVRFQNPESSEGEGSVEFSLVFIPNKERESKE